MALRRFLGGHKDEPTWQFTPAPPPGSQPGDTETIRRIVGELEAMPLDRARHLAAFAFILTRAAEADLDISDVEMRVIEQIVAEHGGLTEAQAVLVAEMARNQEILYGGTEDFLVTRQFRDESSMDERIALLRCCYLVGAADDLITNEESDTLQEIAFELDVERAAVNTIRHEFEPKLAAIQAMLKLQGGAPGS
ncbi:MAG TPA: TerB family tellurite resistance protein [Candidatus Limnocylindrales bacterium]|nr:TerB family tellurite resistance protein [Candidatus Limnocylindrales bacterium]